MVAFLFILLVSVFLFVCLLACLFVCVFLCLFCVVIFFVYMLFCWLACLAVRPFVFVLCGWVSVVVSLFLGSFVLHAKTQKPERNATKHAVSLIHPRDKYIKQRYKSINELLQSIRRSTI